MKAHGLEYSPDRVLFFSDAVFAIAITLLALEIRLPNGIALNSEAAVSHAIGSLVPQYIAFLVSFLVVGRLWAGHVRRYSGGIHPDRIFVSLNLLMLMAVAFTPFPTSVFSVSQTKAATILYAFVMIAVGLFSALTWWYAAMVRHSISVTLTSAEVRAELVAPLVFVLVFGLMAVTALFNNELARWTWLLFIPVFRWIH